MSVRIPSHQCVSIKPRLGRAVVGELRDVSFDGACFAPVDHSPKTRFTQRVRVQVGDTSAPDGAPLEIAARVISVRDGNVILVFEAYGAPVNAYLEHLYDGHLTRESEAVSFWH